LRVPPKASANDSDSPVVIDNVLDSDNREIVFSSAGLSGGSIGIVYVSQIEQKPYYKVFSPSGDVVFNRQLAEGLGAVTGTCTVLSVVLFAGYDPGLFGFYNTNDN